MYYYVVFQEVRHHPHGNNLSRALLPSYPFESASADSPCLRRAEHATSCQIESSNYLTGSVISRASPHKKAQKDNNNKNTDGSLRDSENNDAIIYQ